MEDRGCVGTMVSDGTGDVKENTRGRVRKEVGGRETRRHIHLAVLRGYPPCADLELGL